MSAARCALLIATRNRPQILAETLQRLAEKGFASYPLWIYDDASDDAQAIRDVAATWPGATVVREERQRGQAHGRNVLLRACGTPYAVSLDDDQYFLEAEHLSEHLVEPRRDPACAAVSFQCRARKDGRLDRPAGMPSGPTTWFMGGCVLFHVASVLQVGGYRDWWVYGYEEPELALRLFAAGYTIWYDAAILVEHNQWYNPSERRDFAEYDYLYARNAVLLASLNYPLLLGLPVGLLRSLRRAFFLRRNVASKARGLWHGITYTFARWPERAPMSWRRSLQWMRMNRNG
jgi:GT2 family glycosyltransferase